MAQFEQLPTISKFMIDFGYDKLDAVEKLFDYSTQHYLPSITKKIEKIQDDVSEGQTNRLEVILDLYSKIEQLKKQIDELTQQKERFQHNLMYVEVIEDIINNKETEWEKKTFNNMLVKLVGKEEVYKVFVQTSNAPVIGSKIKFTFNADENKLSQLKLVE